MENGVNGFAKNCVKKILCVVVLLVVGFGSEAAGAAKPRPRRDPTKFFSKFEQAEETKRKFESPDAPGSTQSSAKSNQPAQPTRPSAPEPSVKQPTGPAAGYGSTSSAYEYIVKAANALREAEAEPIVGYKPSMGINKKFINKALMLAAEEGNAAVVADLLKEKEITAPIEEKDSTGKITKVRKKITIKADINATDTEGNTPLLLVLSNNVIDSEQKKNVAKVLINGGANLASESTRGDTPMLVVCKKQDVGLINFLKENGVGEYTPNSKSEVPYSKLEEATKKELAAISTDSAGPTATSAATVTPEPEPAPKPTKAPEPKPASSEPETPPVTPEQPPAPAQTRAEVISNAISLKDHVLNETLNDAHKQAALVFVDADGKTLLHIAVEANKIKSVNKLLEFFGTDKIYLQTQDGPGKKNNLALHYAQTEEVAEALIAPMRAKGMLYGKYKAPAEYIDCPNAKGYTPLMVAAQAGKLEVVKLLETEGANLRANDHADKKSTDGNMAIHLAAQNGQLSVVVYLCPVDQDNRNRAGLTVGNNKGETPLYLAVVARQLGVVQYLVVQKQIKLNDPESSGNGLFPLYMAARKGYLDVIQELIQAADTKGKTLELFKQTTKTKKTALHIAVEMGHAEIVDALLGKDVNSDKSKLLIGILDSAKDSNKENPLHIACKKGNVEIFKKLMAKMNADDSRYNAEKILDILKTNNNDLSSPLYLASQNADSADEIFDSFVENGSKLFDNTDSLKEFIESTAGKFIDVRKKLLLAAIKANNKKLIGALILADSVFIDPKDKVVSTMKDLKDSQGNTTLHLAIQAGNESLAKKLIGAGADINVPNSEGKSSVDLASGEGSTVASTIKAAVQAKVEESKNKPFEQAKAGTLGQNDTGFNLSSIVDVNEKDAEGNTYLFYAASYGHAELAQALVEHGADIEIAGKEGLTPLMIAAGNGRLGVVQYLIDAGASIDHQDVNDDDALVHAAEANHLDVVNELILTNKISGERMGIAMICAAAKFHQEIAELLILNQANLFALLEGDPVWRWTQGETLNIINNAIANKIKVGDITAEDLANIAKIKKEALDSWKDADGNGFAHLAVQMPDNKQDQAVKLIKALKGAGANLDVENGQGLTPLMLAAQNGKGEVVSTLIDAGVDVNKKNSGGYTALMFAAAAGNIDILARLLVAKPDCNVVDAEGKTALTWAVTKNQLEIVKALLAAGAGKELGEYTPLAWAVFTQKDDSVTKALLEKEANPLAPTVFKNANDETKKLLGAAIITRIEQDKLPTEDEIEELIALVPANEILTWRATDGKTMFDMVFTLLGTKENAKLAQSLITHLLGDKDSDDVLGEMLKWEDGSGGTMFDALADLAKTEEKVAQDLAKHMLAGKSAEDIDEMIKKVSGKKATAAFLTAQKSALVKDPLQQSLATVKTQLEKLKGGLSKLQDAVEKLRGSLA